MVALDDELEVELTEATSQGALPPPVERDIEWGTSGAQHRDSLPLVKTLPSSKGDPTVPAIVICAASSPVY